MRAGAIAAGLVAVALAGSLGLVFAQKGDLTALPWGKLKGDAANTGSIVHATSRWIFTRVAYESEYSTCLRRFCCAVESLSAGAGSSAGCTRRWTGSKQS